MRCCSRRDELTEEEYKAMQDARRRSEPACSPKGRSSRSCELADARSRVAHHERWDGSGYPSGFPARTFHWLDRSPPVADVFDALTHERPYKPAWSIEAAVEEIAEKSETHFDPKVVEAFLALDHARLLHPVGRMRPAKWGSYTDAKPVFFASKTPAPS